MHNAPNFLDEDNIPELVFLDVGMSKEIKTGPATEDTIKASWFIKGDSMEWINFMTISYDKKTFAFDIIVSPTEPEHIGKFEIIIYLVDNASDRKSGLTEYETGKPMKSVIKIPVEIFNSNYGAFGGANSGNGDDDGGAYDPLCTGICPPSFSIESFKMDGVINIEFDQEVHIPNDFLSWKGEIVLSTSQIDEKDVIGIMISPDDD